MLCSDGSDGCYTQIIPLPPPIKNRKAKDRAQRNLAPSRVNNLLRYILDNPKSYIVPAITVVINSDVKFDQGVRKADQSSLGILKIPVTANVYVVDGQHRCAAISEVVGYTDDYSDESIAIKFFINRDLKALQQMFADLNRHAAKPTKSIGILYEHREQYPRITKATIDRAEPFRGFVDEEKNTLTKTSGKLFTLNAIYDATAKYLLSKMTISGDEDAEFAVKISVEFWNIIDSLIPQWRLVRENKLSAHEVREDFLHTQSVSLCAIGRVGNYLFRSHRSEWQHYIRKMTGINWSRSNFEIWNGRCLVFNQVKKGSANIILVSNAIKKHIGLDLNHSEQLLEDDLERSRKQ